jgi:hypothetical protein
MNEEKIDEDKNEDKQWMKNKINSMDARTLGLLEHVDRIGNTVGTNRAITIVLWLLGLIIIWFWISRA